MNVVLPNALPMFQPKCITSIAFNFESIFIGIILVEVLS